MAVEVVDLLDGLPVVLGPLGRVPVRQVDTHLQHGLLVPVGAEEVCVLFGVLVDQA
ncbi:hypothetical protein D3C84_1208140 [compost metagenome]